MRVFSDHHHQALTHSLQLLFEKRLGGQLFNPIGLSWFEQGFWKGASVYGDNLGTVGQYLGTRGYQPDSDGIYRFEGGKWITLDKFKEMDIDIVIASIPDHLAPFTDLINRFKPKAKLIFQVGNHFDGVDYSLAKNILASTSAVGLPTNVNVVFYHQEFDTKVYNYTEPNDSNYIRSFVHTLATASHFASDWQTFLELEKLMPEYRFESYGASCRDGCISEQSDIARLMKGSKFGIHLKKFGDGFGHVFWNWAFCGRPLITRWADYKDKLGGTLLKDGKTCILVDNLSTEEIASKIRYYSQVDCHKQMCHNIYDLAKQNCDFDEEEKKISLFLEKLI